MANETMQSQCKPNNFAMIPRIARYELSQVGELKQIGRMNYDS